VLRYRKSNQEWKIAVGGGFAEVTSDRVVILADVAEKAEEIDVDRARRAHERAENALKDLVMDDAEFNKMNSALQRSIARLSAAE